MAMVVIKTGIKLKMLLDEVVIVHHAHQVRWVDDLEVDSPEQKAEPSKDTPEW